MNWWIYGSIVNIRNTERGRGVGIIPLQAPPGSAILFKVKAVSYILNLKVQGRPEKLFQEQGSFLFLLEVWSQ
jgi:hypothetical protein